VSVLRRESGRFRANSPVTHGLTFISQNGESLNNLFATIQCWFARVPDVAKVKWIANVPGPLFSVGYRCGLASVINQISDKG
jgi:hypothetical protein